MRCARRGALPFHRAQHDVALRKRPAKELVHGHRAGGAAGAGAAEPARQRHLFVQPQTQSLRAPARRSTSAAARLATFFIAVAAQRSAIAGDLDDFDAGCVGQLGLEHVAWAAQGQTEHIETWPEIGNSGRCEHADSLISHGFADYRITISAMRGMEWNSEGA